MIVKQGQRISSISVSLLPIWRRKICDYSSLHPVVSKFVTCLFQWLTYKPEIGRWGSLFKIKLVMVFKIGIWVSCFLSMDLCLPFLQSVFLSQDAK